MSRRALITGASAGIGEAYARALAARGDDLVLVARRADRLAALAEELGRARGIDVEVLPADLLDPNQLAAVETRLSTGDITLLVNNAGFGGPGGFADQDVEHATRVLRLNVEALMRLTHAGLQPMKANGAGQIVQIASLGAFQPSPYFAVYAATKAFVLSFSEAVHEEVRAHGIQVLTVCPGFTHTEFQVANDASGDFLPEWMWSQPDQVVSATLKSLERADAVLVPRWHDQITAWVAAIAPRKLVRRAAGFVGRRYGADVQSPSS